MMGLDTSSSLRIKGDATFMGIPIDGMTSVSTSINSDVKTKLSRGRYTAGMVNGAVPDRKSTEVDVKFDQFTVQTFAMAFMGDYTILSQGAGALTDEPIIATLGKYVKLPKRNLLSNSIVVTNSAGDVTYTESTDYSVNYKMGWILPLRDGLITETQALKVDADYAAWSGHRISAETKIDIKGELIIDGVNEDDGSEITIVFPLIRLVSKSKIGFLTEDFGAAEMKGTPILKSGETELYYFDIGS
jgi:hypothetical protein